MTDPAPDVPTFISGLVLGESPRRERCAVNSWERGARERRATAAERDGIVEEYGAIEGGNQRLDRLEAYLNKA